MTHDRARDRKHDSYVPVLAAELVFLCSSMDKRAGRESFDELFLHHRKVPICETRKCSKQIGFGEFPVSNKIPKAEGV